jgi:hypothetical protein
MKRKSVEKITSTTLDNCRVIIGVIIKGIRFQKECSKSTIKKCLSYNKNYGTRWAL